MGTGRELGYLSRGGDVPVPTPIVDHDLIFLTSAHGGDAPVYAIRTSASGDISLVDKTTSNKHIQWAHMRIGNYMQTPLVYGDLLYCCRDSGIMAVYDARTGEKKYRHRLSGGVGFTASPVAADDKVYFTSEQGDVFVIRAVPEFDLLAHPITGCAREIGNQRSRSAYEPIEQRRFSAIGRADERDAGPAGKESSRPIA